MCRGSQHSRRFARRFSHQFSRHARLFTPVCTPCTPVFTPVLTPVCSVNPFSHQCAHQCSHQCAHQCGVFTPAHTSVHTDVNRSWKLIPLQTPVTAYSHRHAGCCVTPRWNVLAAFLHWCAEIGIERGTTATHVDTRTHTGAQWRAQIGQMSVHAE